MEAAYRLFAVHGADAPTIDDVIAEAKIARGTFYNHFDTRDALFRSVAEEIATTVNDDIASVLAPMTDPALRLATAFRLFVRFAVSDETRGWILLRTIPLVGPLSESMRTFIEDEFAAGLASKRLHASSTSVAVDIGIGLQVMTIHRLLADRVAHGYIEEAAEALLAALGLPDDEASALARSPLG